MSLDTTQFWSHKLVHDELRSIATTENPDASSTSQSSRGGVGSVSTNESVQTSVGDAGSIGQRTIPSRRELTEDEIERRACQGFAKLPQVQDTYDLWRHCSYDVEKRIRLKARQAEEVLAQAKGESIKQDPHTVPKLEKTSITADASSSYVSVSSVISHGVTIKREMKEETVSFQLRRNKGSRHSANPLGLAISASSKGHSNPKVVKRETRPRRRRFDDSGKDLRGTRIEQERKSDQTGI
jgi:hypothetical protein